MLYEPDSAIQYIHVLTGSNVRFVCRQQHDELEVIAVLYNDFTFS